MVYTSMRLRSVLIAFVIDIWLYMYTLPVQVSRKRSAPRGIIDDCNPLG